MSLLQKILAALKKILQAIKDQLNPPADNVPTKIIIKELDKMATFNTSQRVTVHGDTANAKGKVLTGIPGVMDWSVAPSGVVSLFPSDAASGSRDCVVTGVAPGDCVVTAKLTLPDGTTVITGQISETVVADPADAIPTHIVLSEGAVEAQ